MSLYGSFLAKCFGGTVALENDRALKLEVRTQRNIKWARHCALTRHVASRVGAFHAGPVSPHGRRYTADGRGRFMFCPDTAVVRFIDLPQSERALALARVWETLSRLHAQDIAQGNVTPENILFDRDPSALRKGYCKFINWSDGSGDIPNKKWPNRKRSIERDLAQFLTLIRETVSLDPSISCPSHRETVIVLLRKLCQ